MRRLPVIVIALDAAERTLVERLIARGRMPNLAALRDRGASGRIQSHPAGLSGAVWPDFYTGAPTAWHGSVHYRLWRPDTMRCDFMPTGFPSLPPFWDRLAAAGLRTADIDVPMLTQPPRAPHAVRVTSWNAHHQTGQRIWPAHLRDDLIRSVGPPAIGQDPWGRATLRSLRETNWRCLREVQQTERIAHHVRSIGPWDLLVVVFNALHRGGHYLWDLSQVQDPIPDAFEVRDLGGALAELYEACDRSLGHLIQAAPAETRILVFALHGMGPNPVWPDRTESLYAHLTGATRGSAARPSLLRTPTRRDSAARAPLA